jgi:hypothetical protein
VSIRLSWSRRRLEVIEFHASQPPRALALPRPANQTTVNGWLPVGRAECQGRAAGEQNGQRGQDAPG